MDDAPHDCLACGVCCFSHTDRYVRVSGDDYERLGESAEALVSFIGNEAFMRMEGGHCAALRIDDTSGAPQFFCTVYEARPSTCRTLERASPECAGERHEKHDRPLLALRRAR